MIHRLVASVCRRWQLSPLRAKLLIPIVGLMALSLLGSTVVFLVGTARTQEQLLSTETLTDQARVLDALDSPCGSGGDGGWHVGR